MEAFKKDLAKLLFKIMDAQELQDPEKVSKIWVKYLNSIVNKMNNTKSLMISMKKRDAECIFHSKVRMKHIQKKMYYPKMVYTNIYINLAKNMETKNDKSQTLSGLQIHAGQTKSYKEQVIVFCTICKVGLIRFLYVRN